MDKFANLPSPLKWILGATGVGTLVAAGGLAGSGRWMLLLIFFLVLIGLLVIILGAFLLWNVWQRKRQNAQLKGEIQQSTSGAVQGMSAENLAKLDSLRKKFQEGVEAFRSRGKDLYSLPWYVIIGEPGSGKTEAIRHCNVGFPPGMHEGENDAGYMGAGGTINMNWWFTNYAVMLDTAGRLVFEEIKAGETSEWKEFLKLLKKNRPHSPINGLMLVIPSDSLIKDTADQIASKAGKIAQQLDVIQRVLDFRFPVYVVVTKSDKINGFREFFEGMTDPQLQHQMLGWTNPDPLDSAFRPEVVDKHLTHVADRLRKRRLALLRDPVPESASRRLDEVDALYALPNSLLLLAPRLRSYLEKIFMPGQWSAKPLFLRGIFFTSSMREGASLDQELAEAIGVSAEELPEGKVWERERAYFLRDMFVEKVFKEKGLVTRATNTSSMLRRRQMILYGACFVALAVFITFGWLSMRSIRGSVAGRNAFWSAAANAGWSDASAIWGKAIVKDVDGNWTLDAGTVTFGGEKLTLSQVQQRLRGLAETNVEARWTAPGLAGSYNGNSKIAQRIVFETGVLKPLWDGVKQNLKFPGTDTATNLLPDALALAISLEADVLSRPAELDARRASNFLSVCSRFVAGGDLGVDTNLVPVMVWTYTGNPDSKGEHAWPPAWLSWSTTINKTPTNDVLLAALDCLVSTATNTVQTATSGWSQVGKLQVSLRGLETAEKEFFAAVKTANAASAAAALQKLEKAKGEVDQLLAAAATNSLFKEALTFKAAQTAFTNQIMIRVAGAFSKVQAANDSARKKHSQWPLFTTIANRLQKEQSQFSSGLVSFVSAADAREFARFDEAFLAAQGGLRACDQRWDLYRRAAGLLQAAKLGGAQSRAQLLQAMDKTAGESASLDKAFTNYTGYASSDVAAVGRYYLGQAQANLVAGFSTAYPNQVNTDLRTYLTFPLVKSTGGTVGPDQVPAAGRSLDDITAEAADASRKLPALKDDRAWTNFTARLESLRYVAAYLKGKDGKPHMCTVSLKLPNNRSNPAERWSEQLVRLQLAGDTAVARVDQSDVEAYQELTKVPLDRPFSLRLLDIGLNPGTSEEVGGAGAWGLLALMAKNPGKERQPGVYDVQCALRRDQSQMVTLRVAFDDAFPFNHWLNN